MPGVTVLTCCLQQPASRPAQPCLPQAPWLAELPMARSQEARSSDLPLPGTPASSHTQAGPLPRGLLAACCLTSLTLPFKHLLLESSFLHHPAGLTLLYFSSQTLSLSDRLFILYINKFLVCFLMLKEGIFVILFIVKLPMNRTVSYIVWVP